MLKENYEFNEQDFNQLRAEAFYLENQVNDLKEELATAKDMANRWNNMLCMLKDQMADFITSYAKGELDPQGALSLMGLYMAVPVEKYNPKCYAMRKEITGYLDEIINYLMHEVPGVEFGSMHLNKIDSIAKKIYNLTVD